MAKKVLFFDVDGTLVNEKNEIPESALKAIAKTRELGNLVTHEQQTHKQKR